MRSRVWAGPEVALGHSVTSFYFPRRTPNHNFTCTFCLRAPRPSPGAGTVGGLSPGLLAYRSNLGTLSCSHFSDSASPLSRRVSEPPPSRTVSVIGSKGNRLLGLSVSMEVARLQAKWETQLVGKDIAPGGRSSYTDKGRLFPLPPSTITGLDFHHQVTFFEGSH